jgi:glutamyl-Q tRNA(Asp) synthetase
VRPGCADEIQRTLGQLGLHWDGEVEYQSRRRSLFEEAIAELTRQRLTYACQCTRRMLGEFEESAYPGTCRNRAVGNGATAVRFRVNETDTMRFTDRFQGPCEFAMRLLGDVVIRRRDGVFAYQLAVVVDDAAQGITDVVRGADLLESTAWQIPLQRALGLPTPRYAHLPLVVEPGGEKLSKTRRSVSVQPGRASRELVGALNLLRQAPPEALLQETPQTILGWALGHWKPVNLERVQKVAAPVKLP